MTAADAEGADNYEPFFGLREAPFALAPNPRFRFASASHSAALTQMAAAIERREPLVVVIGEIGTGKTLLCRTMLQQLPRKTFLSVVSDPMLDRDDLLKQLLEDFGVISKDRARLSSTTRHDLVEALLAFLHSLVSIGAHAVVIVDEAQHLQPEVLEQIRLLSNVDDEHGALLQVMLVGQIDLESLLARPDLRQLSQRVSRRVRLEPLDDNEVRQYIEHRLALVRDARSSPMMGAAELAEALADWDGASAPSTPLVEFTPDAIHAVARLSHGLPRVVNLLCDRALSNAYHVRLRIIEVPMIETAAAGLGLLPVSKPVHAAMPAAEPVKAAPKSDAPVALPSLDAQIDEAVGTPASDIQPHAEPVPVDLGAVERPPSSRSVRYAGIAAVIGAAAVAIWLGVRATRTSTTSMQPSSPAQVSAPALPPTARSDAPKPEAPTTAAGTSQAPASSAAPAPSSAAMSPSAAAQAPAGENAHSAAAPVTGTPSAAGARFELVVASFKTDARASAVGTAVAALDLPVRRRVSDGWQQVISGPFASREAAEAARDRLNRAGLTGAQIVPVEP